MSALILAGLGYLIYLFIQKIFDSGYTFGKKTPESINILLNLYTTNHEINSLFEIENNSNTTIKDLFKNLYDKTQNALQNDFIFKGIITKKLIDVNNQTLLINTYYKYCEAFLKNQDLFEGASSLSQEDAELFIKKFEKLNEFQKKCNNIEQTYVYFISTLVVAAALLCIMIFCFYRLASKNPSNELDSSGYSALRCYKNQPEN